MNTNPIKCLCVGEVFAVVFPLKRGYLAKEKARQSLFRLNDMENVVAAPYRGRIAWQFQLK